MWGSAVCRSEKNDKMWAHRALRAAVRRWLNEDPEMIPAPLVRETSNVWSFGKDGKSQHFRHDSTCFRLGCFYETEHWKWFGK